MAVTELHSGRRTSMKKAERQYKITGETSEGNALVSLITGVPSTVNGFSLAESECDVEEISTNLFIGTAIWTAPGDYTYQQVGSFQISFDIAGQSQHITQSILTSESTAAPDFDLRDFKGAINVNTDGSVEGVDIIVPTFNFTLNYTADPDAIDSTYIQTLKSTVGKINNGTYKGFGEAELLLTRVSGSRRDNDHWDLSFGFGVSETDDSITIGDISGITKRGWDYMWVYYKEEPDEDNLYIRKVPKQVNCEQVYKEADYSALGLP
jgi:hypothetical protein